MTETETVNSPTTETPKRRRNEPETKYCLKVLEDNPNATLADCETPGMTITKRHYNLAKKRVARPTKADPLAALDQIESIHADAQAGYEALLEERAKLMAQDAELGIRIKDYEARCKAKGVPLTDPNRVEVEVEVEPEANG